MPLQQLDRTEQGERYVRECHRGIASTFLRKQIPTIVPQRLLQQPLHYTIITFVGHMPVEVLDPTFMPFADDQHHIGAILVLLRLMQCRGDRLRTVDDCIGRHMAVGDMIGHIAADVLIRFGVGVFRGEHETADTVLCGLDDAFTPVDRLVARPIRRPG